MSGGGRFATSSVTRTRNGILLLTTKYMGDAAMRTACGAFVKSECRARDGQQRICKECVQST
jgi:hypothetical protein